MRSILQKLAYRIGAFISSLSPGLAQLINRVAIGRLFAQPRTPDGPLPPLLQTMVAVDAFSQALTNPLLSQHVWGDPDVQRATFTYEGLEAIGDTRTHADILARNSTPIGDQFVGMTRQGWQRGRE